MATADVLPLFDGDVIRIVAKGLQVAELARLGSANTLFARELLGPAAESLWSGALRQDFGGNSASASALCGVASGDVSRTLYSKVARVFAGFRECYSVSQGDISHPPRISGRPPEALVVPTHPQLVNVGFGAASAVHRAAGPRLGDYVEELLAKRPQGFDIASSVTCPGFDTGAKAIIFVISPPQFMAPEVAAELLVRCYRGAFEAVRAAQASTVALAAIATGAGGCCPVVAGATAAWEALAHVAAGGGACMSVCFDAPTAHAFETARKEVLSRPLARSDAAAGPSSEPIDVDPDRVLARGLARQDRCSVQ